MKRCPTCQKEFPDSMRFCQTDGTPLVEEAVKDAPKDAFNTPIPPPVNVSSDNDPMKTMVVDSQSKDDDILQIPEVFDPMKTVVVSNKDLPKKEEPVVSAPEPPKFSEPSLSPPNFGDLSSGSSKEPPKVDSPFSNNPFNEPPKSSNPISSPFNDPPKSEPFSPFNDPPKADSPFSSPFSDPPKCDPLPPSDISQKDSPFNKPLNEPVSSPFNDPVPPPYKEPAFGNPPPFENSPFGQPQTPFGEQQNDPFNPPLQQNDWTPPPAPVSNWQVQGLGSNTPFTPPAAGAGGQNQTLAIVSLVSGILSCLCCFSIITGPLAVILGFMARNKATASPMEYGGSGLALAGMITGGIGAVVGTIVMILQLLPLFIR